jgi:hypothetical protein
MQTGTTTIGLTDNRFGASGINAPPKRGVKILILGELGVSGCHEIEIFDFVM